MIFVIPAPEYLAQSKHLVSVELAKQLNDETTLFVFQLFQCVDNITITSYSPINGKSLTNTVAIVVLIYISLFKDFLG